MLLYSVFILVFRLPRSLLLTAQSLLSLSEALSSDPQSLLHMFISLFTPHGVTTCDHYSASWSPSVSKLVWDYLTLGLVLFDLLLNCLVAGLANRSV